MRVTDTVLSALALVGSASVVAAQDQAALNLLQTLNDEAIKALEAKATSVSKRTGNCVPRSCNVHNAEVRKDWAVLSTEEKKAYIKAVKCIRTLPSKADPSFAPGAKSRYDDFVAVHINQTLTIHGTGNFLTWHRYTTWAYEQALKTECGYTGTQPYWNWFANTDDLTKSPVFDGSETSIGGDGEFVPHNGTLAAPPALNIPSGAGGGCVKSGPFTDAELEVRLGPVSPGMDGMFANPGGPLAADPRCLRRDLNTFAVKSWMTYENLFNLTMGPAGSSISAFQSELQGRFTDGFLGLHATGHMAVGGDATDIFSSINDPSFFLHHSMVDRVFWMWQVLHPDQANELGGTITLNNNPASRNTLKTDLINQGVNAPARPIADLLNTLGNTPLCYIYQ